MDGKWNKNFSCLCLQQGCQKFGGVNEFDPFVFVASYWCATTRLDP